MRTVLVNPHRGYAAANPRPRTITRYVQAPAPARRAANPMPVVMVNPRRRRRGRRRVSVNPVRRVIVPRRRRRNPEFDIKLIAKTALTAGLASGAAYLVNKVGVARLGVTATGADTANGVLIREAVRVALAAAGKYFMPGMAGDAFAGAMLYPFWYEIDGWWMRNRTAAQTGTATTSAQVAQAKIAAAEEGAGTEAELEAQLEAALSGWDRAA